jgi:hypothetical protein
MIGFSIGFWFPAGSGGPNEWVTAQELRADNSAPSWELDRTVNSAGNSLSVGTGSAITTNAAIQAEIGGGSSFGVGVNYQVGAGTNMAEALTYLNANWTTADKAEDLVLVDPVAGELLTVGTKRFDFWRTDATFNDFEAIRVQNTGGAETVLLLVASPYDSWSATFGIPMPEYTHWKARAVAKSYSPNIIDVRQHMIDWYGLENGFEATQREWNEMPVGLCGNASLLTLARSAADIVVENPLTLDHAEGDPLTRAAASNDYALFQKVGATGTGSTIEADQVHPNARGRQVMAILTRDWDLGRQGFAPFLPPGVRFKTTSNVANGATIGVVRMRGVADSISIAFGNQGGAFTATAGGPDVNGYGTITITRTAGTPINEGEYRLYITAVKGAYQRTEIVRVMVMAASGARVPTPMQWDTPIYIKGPRASVQVATSKRFSYLFRGRIDDLSSTRMLCQLVRGVSTDTLFVRIGIDGRVTLNARDAANQLVLQSVSRSLVQGGPVIQAGVEFTLMGAFDWELGLRNGRLNGADLPLIGTGTTFASINSAVNFNDCSPVYLANQQPNGLWPGEGASASGEITAACFWPDTYIDWAANESSVIDGSGNFILSDPAYTIAGVASHPVRVRGPVADLFAGGQDSSVTVLPLWRPSNIIDAV